MGRVSFRKGSRGDLYFQLQCTVDSCGQRSKIALVVFKQHQERSSCIFQHPSGCPGLRAALQEQAYAFPEIGSQLFTYTNNVTPEKGFISRIAAPELWTKPRFVSGSFRRKESPETLRWSTGSNSNLNQVQPPQSPG